MSSDGNTTGRIQSAIRSAGAIPHSVLGPEWEQIRDGVEHPIRRGTRPPRTGTLVTNTRTGIYALALPGGGIVSVPQNWAARIAGEVGDEVVADRSDWIQARVISRAEELGLTAYAIAKASGGAVSEDHVQAYLTRRKSMGSHKLQHVLRALGLELTVSPGTK